MFTIGTKMCPCSCAEVCNIRRRGSRSSCTAWRVTEKAPVIVACEAMMAASVASNTIHGSMIAGTSANNGLWAADGSANTRAPWPK